LKSVKPPKNAPADDRWVPGSWADSPEYQDEESLRRTFRPINLTVFHLALLVHIVHRLSPLYSLFKRNCLWFTALIFSALKILDRVLHKGPDAYPEEIEEIEDPVVPKDMIDYVFLPLFLLAPDALGHFMGFKVCEVKSIVVNRIVDIFLKQLEEHEHKVDRTFFLIFQYFTNFLTACQIAGDGD
jgi:hypothetical protein